MENSLQLESDYRKWLSYNDNIKGFKNLYDLHQSVSKKENFGGFSISNDDSSLLVEQKGNKLVLKLVDDTEQSAFLEYMKKHYLPSENLDDWYLENMQKEDKAKNHKVDDTAYDSNGNKDLNGLKIHPKESKYFKIRLFFSLAFYAALMLFLIISFVENFSKGLFALTIAIGIILLFALMKRVIHGLFIGLIKGSSVKLNKTQYKEVYEIVLQQSKLLRLPEPPEVYITYGGFNAFVTKLARKKYLVLQSEVVETAINDNYDVLRFVIGHELGHIKNKHLIKDSWLFPSSLIPFLKNAHSRGCEYTCDRVGYHFSKQGAFEGILMLAAGKTIYSKINIDEFVQSSFDRDSFWFWLSEKFISHPHLSKRMEAIKAYSERKYD